MTKIWRKQEWERQLQNKSPEDCISIPKGLILNKSKKNDNKLIRKNKEDVKKKN
jgi:hypothetical protein|tara:strand:+ start:610 stop:771 length:162 start_codon:yes stop_codon:yes gene_type:complete